MFTSTIPFSNSGPAAAAKAIVNGKRPPRPLHPVLTSQLWTLVQRCWAQDPRLRPEASEVLKVLPAPSVFNPFRRSSVPYLTSSDLPSWKRLISDPLHTDEYISLITSIFSKHNKINVVEYLSGDDAQIFIDVIYKVSLRFISSPKNRFNVSVNSRSNIRVLSARCWKVSHQRSVGDVYALYPGFAAAKPCFRKH